MGCVEKDPISERCPRQSWKHGFHLEQGLCRWTELKAKHGSAVIPVLGETEAGGSPVLSQPGLYTETLSQKERKGEREERRK